MLTYEQAEAIARQLTIVWRDAADGDNLRVKWRWEESHFDYELRFGEHFIFSATKGGYWRLSDRKVIRKKRCAPRFIPIGGIVFEEKERDYYEEHAAEHNGESQDEFDEFAQTWGGIFRRCCWLAGADIECSATERGEWGCYARENGIPLELVIL